MFCYNCMNRISDQNNYCRHCGRNSYPDRTPHHITPGSDLKGRYLVGNAVGEDGFTITYVARDLNIDERVVLKEYYPMGHVHRDSDTSNEIVLNSQDEAAYFGKGSDQFISDAREAKRSFHGKRNRLSGDLLSWSAARLTEPRLGKREL